MKFGFVFAFVFWLNPLLFSQTTVRGWYADGQVWIMWDLDNSPPETYAIYSSPTPFTNTNQAQLIGRLYEEEWLPFALRTQINANANYVIPDGQGGRFTLPPNTGLFVETVHESGAKYYAVVKWGDTAVTNNITPNAISYTYDVNDPVECHPQGTTTLASGHRATAYYMWADGRDNHWEGRPDFPIMANRHKNGMPSFFIVSEAKNLPPGKVSAVHWLHGGDGVAKQSLPTSRASINIEPQDGLLVAHNDDLIRKIIINGVVTKITQHSNSWFFGWAKNLDPFDNIITTPTDTDTVINYTQRRLLWINDWLIKNRNVDPERVAIQGHSMGSAGTTALAKAFPNTFATACIFNNGFGGPEQGSDIDTTLSPGRQILGTPQQNLPTNLRNYRGEVVHAYDLFNVSTPIASTRDMTLMRSWHGKNDDNGTMEWDAYVVEEYKRADSSAWGMQLFWDERTHGIDNLQVHWSHGPGNAQTERDDAAYQVRYFANQSFPAFYNHQKYPGSNKDPGDGTRGTGGAGVGDDWGSFGGYHDWDVNSIIDTPDRWEVSAYLIGLSSHAMDNSPDESLTSDFAIRKPQQFLPAANTLLSWLVVSLTSGDTLQRGTTVVDDDGLVKADGITVYRDPERVRIIFTTQEATPGKDCTKTSIGQTPLTDLGTGTYQGYQGGLYPGGSNLLPIAHKAAGLLAAAQIKPLSQTGSVDLVNGKIALISIGPSFATMEFSAFKLLAAQDVTINPKLVLVDGAQSGKSAEQFADTTDFVWTVIAQRLSNANVTSQQVQVAWVKSVNTIHNAGFPADQTKLRDDLAQIARNLRAKFPNIKLAYFSSRSYGGYGDNEPYPYETGFAVKWLIEKQINGDSTLAFSGANPKAPWLAWGPYLWADGTTPRQDSLFWECSDFQDDGVHPSLSGRAKVARMLLAFFKTDSTANSWFLMNPPTSIETAQHFSPRGFALEQNYPNPFNPSTTIRFFLPGPMRVTLKVFDVSGREVTTLVNGKLAAGEHAVVFEANHLPSGIYFIQLAAGGFTQIRKATLIK